MPRIGNTYLRGSNAKTHIKLKHLKMSSEKDTYIFIIENLIPNNHLMSNPIGLTCQRNTQ